MRVLDASVVVEILLQTPLGIRHVDHVLDPADEFHVPHLVDIEVAHTIRRLALAGEISKVRAETALGALLDLELVRHEHTAFVARIWELRRSLTAYDATYIALAESLSALLLTCDGRLARSHGHRARVELLT